MSGTMTSEDRIFEKLDAIEARISALDLGAAITNSMTKWGITP